MGKTFRIISTLMIAIGIFFVFIYTQAQNSNKMDILNQPSYYVIQNYWYIFISGIAVILFSLLGSFFSWFKKWDTTEEILPNAGYVSEQDITAWVSGSTVDRSSKTEVLCEDQANNADGKTDILNKEAEG